MHDVLQRRWHKTGLCRSCEMVPPGHCHCSIEFGIYYVERSHGGKVSNAEAAKLYRKAAERGFDEAQYMLGKAYDKGVGVKRDKVEAAKWYRKAAEQDNALAQLSLGRMYERGEGVKKDKAEAGKWYRKAADLHLMDGELALDEMTSKSKK